MARKHVSNAQQIKQLQTRIDKEKRRLERKYKVLGTDSDEIQKQIERVERFVLQLDKLERTLRGTEKH